MRMFNVVYEQHVQPVGASDHIAARRLGSKHLANKLGALDGDKVAVIDCELAGYYGKHLLAAQRKSDPKCYACNPADSVPMQTGSERRLGESVWARIQQEELDKVHEIWCRRAGDAKHDARLGGNS